MSGTGSVISHLCRESNQTMMQYIRFLFLFLLVHSLQAQQSPPLRIVYENVDAFNALQRSPHLAPYIANKDGVKFIKGTERTTLRLYEHAGIYLTDSVYVDFPGSKAKAWRYSIVSIRDYSSGRKWSVYPNLPPNYAYAESCKEDQVWDIDERQTKQILGLTCYYASTVVDQVEHQIWFTKDFGYKDGPIHSRKKYHCNLPGLVLEHIVGDGNVTRAIDISFIAPLAGVAQKVGRIQKWEESPRPSYPPEDPDSDGFMLINSDFLANKWTPLIYTTAGHQVWLSN